MTTRRQALRSREPGAILASVLLIFSIVAAGYVTPASATPADPGPVSADGNRSVTPNDMNSGALLLQSQDGRYVEAPRLNTDVNIIVTGSIARTVVTQRFENPNDRWVEGVYVFPLPEQSAVDGLRMEIGTRVIEGQIKGRDEARELYQEARDNGQKASLVEQERPNIFTNSVANIGPHEAVVIRIEYQETVKLSAGIYSLRFPLVVAPRYSPSPTDLDLVKHDGRPAPSTNDPVPDRDRIEPPVLRPEAGKINPVSLQVSLNAGFALGDIKSSYHQIAIKQVGEKVATLALADGTVPADKDFELTWRPKAAAAPQMALFHEAVSSDHYMLAMVTPPSLETDRKLPPREIIFVIDNSGSMAGTSIVQAKQSLLYALGRLHAGDRFNVIRFDDTMEQLFEGPVDATSENLAIAKHFVSRLDAEGGTEMLPALQAALLDDTPNDKTRLRQVVFLTDGAVGNEVQLFSEIMDKRGRSRLFTVGIGSAPNAHFMRRAAEAGRGTFTEIGSENHVLERMTALFAKLERPAMTNLQAVWTDGGEVESWPDPLPDLYAGEPVTVSARMDKRDGELRLTGEFDGRPWSQVVKLSDAVDGSGVGKLWARNKIASLEAKAYADPTTKDVSPLIKAVAIEHHLVSSETSLVAVDPNPSRSNSEAVSTTDMPVNLPDGWNYDKVFGPKAKTQSAGGYGRSIQVDSANDLAAARPAPNSIGLAAPAPGESALPQVAQAPDMVPPAPDKDTGTLSLEERKPDDARLESGAAMRQDAGDSQLTGDQPAPMPSVGVESKIEIMLLLLTILSVMTILLWHHRHRRGMAPRSAERRLS